MHLLLTNKGERLYMPDFGTNLKKYLFEPNIESTNADIRSEIQTSINKYIPNLKIDTLTVTPSDDNEHSVFVKLEYTVTNDTFQQSDFVIIQI
jgi:phage baseplate assembly protein W